MTPGTCVVISTVPAVLGVLVVVNCAGGGRKISLTCSSGMNISHPGCVVLYSSRMYQMPLDVTAVWGAGGKDRPFIKKGVIWPERQIDINITPKMIIIYQAISVHT